MTTITIQVPDSLETEHDETVRFLAAKLYEANKLSYGQAAKMCGSNIRDFADVLVEYKVDFFQYTADDIRHDADSIK